MAYRNACFISYKHPPGVHQNHHWMEFARVLEDEIKRHLAVPMSTYRDDKLPGQPGIKYTRELSEQLCKSVCMIAILSDEYWASSWCVAEWNAMVELERKRLGEMAGRDSLIIPVVARGTIDKWKHQLGHRESLDFKQVHVPSRQMRTVGNTKKVRAIAEMISNKVRELTDPCADCDHFVLPIVDSEEKITISPTTTTPF